MTLIIELPDDLAARYAALPPEQAEELRQAVNAFAVARLTQGRATVTLPPLGFAADARLKREAKGDFGDYGQKVKDQERADWQERERRLGILNANDEQGLK